MKLWLISQTVNGGYDTYDSAVVAAESEDAARLTYPNGGADTDWYDDPELLWQERWADPSDVTVEYLGEARKGHPAGVVCASFNAG